MAALAFWFNLRGCVDFTKHFVIRQVLKGLRKDNTNRDAGFHRAPGKLIKSLGSWAIPSYSGPKGELQLIFWELTQESASFLDKRFSSWIVESQADYAGLRCQSLPSTDSQEEAELTYVVPHPLLQLSISSSSTESTLECAQNMPMDWLNYKDHFSAPTEMGVNNSTQDAVNSGAFFVEISAQSCNSIKERTCTIFPTHADGSSFSYIYHSPSREMTDTLYDFRYPADMTQWAIEYLK
ncbi:uncharacterized protein LOC134612163 [Pelobates fuscus]|uniref:uncharacterized protein LOC134612163 n=1 Tax=Pelobates fuscus TaxID=191477 RepID=UPI002FE49063